MPMRYILKCVFLVLGVLWWSGCVHSGVVYKTQDAGCVAGPAAEGRQEEGERRITALRESYMSGLRALFNDQRASQAMKLKAAMMMSKVGDADALAWLARGFREATGMRQVAWTAAIGSVILEEPLVAQLAHSEDEDKNLAAALLLVFTRMREERQPLLTILGKNLGDATTVRLALIALASNSSWKEGLADIAQLAERQKDTADTAGGARAALATFVGELGEMTNSEFRSYVEARLKEMPGK